MRPFIYLAIILVVTAGCKREHSAERKLHGAANKPGEVQSVEVRYASGFTIEKGAGFTRIKVNNPWREGEVLATYLVKENNAIKNFPNADFIFDKPLTSIITQSTTGSAYLSQLGLQNRIKAVCDASYICDTVLYKRYQTKELINLGNANTVGAESIISLQPEVYIKYIYKSIEESDKKIMQAGVPVFYLTEYMEANPLGRAEWLKVIGILTGTEQKADSLFASIESNYLRLVQQGKNYTEKPKVLAGANFKGTWYTPGGKSYMAQLINDAGGDYFWKNDSSTGSVPLSFELVFEKQKDCTVWINANAASLNELLGADSRYRGLTAFNAGNVYHYDKLRNPQGGIGYFELGVVRPDLLLADLIEIFHSPQESSQLTTTFWRKLK